MKVSALSGAAVASIPATAVQDDTDLAEAEEMAATIAQAAVASAVERDAEGTEPDEEAAALSAATGPEQDVKAVVESAVSHEPHRTDAAADQTDMREPSPALRRQRSEDGAAAEAGSKKARLE